MEPVKRVTGRMAPLDRADVDTDQIIPKQFLKRIERTGYGPFLFYDWRQVEDFALNRPEYQGASVLVTGANFGCGSSREHAPWAIRDAGFRAIVSPSFADIFLANCYKTGLLAVTLPESQVRHLIDLASEDPAAEVSVDLEAQQVRARASPTVSRSTPSRGTACSAAWTRSASSTDINPRFRRSKLGVTRGSRP